MFVLVLNFLSNGKVKVALNIKNSFWMFFELLAPKWTLVEFFFQITDMDALIEKMDYYLNEYNIISKSPMNLVMFKFAIEHVSRVSRVLMQPNGNVLLVGIGGSGRHSSAKLAGFMAEYGIYEVNWKQQL